MLPTLNIGLLGFGTVGRGVYEQIEAGRSIIEPKLGKKIRISKILVSRPFLDRGPELSHVQFTDDLQSLLNDKNIDAIFELTGDAPLAEQVVEDCISRCRAVITANKAFLALNGPKYYRLAKQHKVPFGYEAAVCSGTPAIGWITKGYSGDQITSITGILNSTTNHILGEMEKGISLKQALFDAQQKGYAEPDAGFDIEGLDTAHKLTVLIHHTLDESFHFDELPVNGITQLTTEELKDSLSQNCRTKLIGHAEKTASGIQAWVRPVRIPLSHSLATVDGLENGIHIESLYGGSSLIKGAGAGARSAASGVISDLINLLSD